MPSRTSAADTGSLLPITALLSAETKSGRPKIVFVQQLEVLQRVYQTTIITGGACQVRVGFPNRFRNQHFIALTGEMQPLCFAVRRPGVMPFACIPCAAMRAASYSYS